MSLPVDSGLTLFTTICAHYTINKRSKFVFLCSRSVNNCVNYTYSIRTKEKQQSSKRARIPNNGTNVLLLVAPLTYLCMEYIISAGNVLNWAKDQELDFSMLVSKAVTHSWDTESLFTEGLIGTSSFHIYRIRIQGCTSVVIFFQHWFMEVQLKLWTDQEVQPPPYFTDITNDLCCVTFLHWCNFVIQSPITKEF